MQTIEQKGLKPSFGNSFGHGWEVMTAYFLVLLLVVILLGLVTSPGGLTHLNFNPESTDWEKGFKDIFQPTIALLGIAAVILGILGLAYALLVVPVFEYGGDLMFVHAARGIRPDFETLVQGFKENYLHIVLANLLKSALVMLGFIFLFVPGIIVACRLVFVSYLVMDKKLDPVVAIEESWKLTRGYGWTVFFMGFTSFFIYILGFAMLFVGVLPAAIWTKSSFASLYESILIEKNSTAAIV